MQEYKLAQNSACFHSQLKQVNCNEIYWHSFGSFDLHFLWGPVNISSRSYLGLKIFLCFNTHLWKLSNTLAMVCANIVVFSLFYYENLLKRVFRGDINCLWRVLKYIFCINHLCSLNGRSSSNYRWEKPWFWEVKEDTKWAVLMLILRVWLFLALHTIAPGYVQQVSCKNSVHILQALKVPSLNCLLRNSSVPADLARVLLQGANGG